MGLHKLTKNERFFLLYIRKASAERTFWASTTKPVTVIIASFDSGRKAVINRIAPTEAFGFIDIANLHQKRKNWGGHVGNDANKKVG